MAVEPTSIAGLYVVRWPVLTDERGFFKQTYQAEELKETLRRPVTLAQGNHSRSAANVLRGFHTEPWDKLVYVARGSAICVVADGRPESETFGSHLVFHLGDHPGHFDRLFISQGLSNAFYCLTETDYLNDVSRAFDPVHRSGIAWDDDVLGVDWPSRTPTLSDADKRWPTLRKLYPDRCKLIDSRPRAGTS